MKDYNRNLMWVTGVVAVLFFISLAIGFSDVNASPKHDSGTVVINNYYNQPPPSQPTDMSTTTYVDSGGDIHEVKSDYEKKIGRAVAASMAAGSCQFDYATGFQGCASFGWYDDETGVNFQVGKRVDDLLFNGGIACDIDFEECAGIGAVNWHF